MVRCMSWEFCRVCLFRHLCRLARGHPKAIPHYYGQCKEGEQ